MVSKLYRLLVTLAQRGAFLATLAFLVVVTHALWLFVNEPAGMEQRRAQEEANWSARREAAAADLERLDREMEKQREELRVSQDRASRAGRVAKNLRGLQSRWKRWFGDAEQQRANEAQIRRMDSIRGEAQQNVLRLQRELTQKGWEREGAEMEHARSQEVLARVQRGRSPVRYYLLSSWQTMRPWIFGGLAVLLLGPWVLRTALYYVVGPLARSGRPIRFAADVPALPQEGPSQATLDVALWPGEVLRVKRSYLRSSEAGVEQGTRAFLDGWRPLTSLLSGLIRVAELKNRQARGAALVTLSGGDESRTELAVLNVPEGGSFIVRPRFVAGVIHPAAQPLQIRTRWPLWSRQAWITAQLRFVEFCGPCRLILAGVQGVRTERLAPDYGGDGRNSRTERAALIGFTPNLEYHVVRTPSFLPYLRRRRRLFQALFSGDGIYMVAQAEAGRGRGAASRALYNLRDRLLNLLGV